MNPGINKLKMKLVILSVVALLSVSVSAKDNFSFKSERFPENGYAQPGDAIKFSAQLTKNGKPVDYPIQAWIHVEGEDRITKSGNGKITMQITAPEKGFVYFSAKYIPEGEKRPVNRPWLTSVGVNAEKIVQGMPEPADFDSFWMKAKNELKEVPVNTTLKEIAVEEEYKGKVKCYEVRIDAPGPRRVFGYLSIPVREKDEKLPAMIVMAGAGVYKQSPQNKMAAEGFLTLSVNAHGIDFGENSTEEQMITEMKKGLYYSARDWDKPKKVPFYYMILRNLRALEYLKTRPEWNKTHLISFGASQGGAQSLSLTGLSPEITFCYAGVPGLCNNGGVEKKQARGWPGNFKWNNKTKITAGYLDNCNFARRIKCPAIVSVSLHDFLSRPSTIYAAYNNIKTEKEILTYPFHGHGGAIKKDLQFVLEKMKQHVQNK